MNFLNPKVLSYIPARSGSKRIRGKNIRDFLGKPLIAYTIEQMLKISYVDKVIVDTNSEEIAEIAKKMGCLTVGIVTLPFIMEGQRRYENAVIGLEKLERIVDTLRSLFNLAWEAAEKYDKEAG